MKSRLFFALLIISALQVAAEIPAGYYSTAEGEQDEALKSALYNIVRPHTRIEYGAKGTWVVFRTSDVRPDGSIWDMYSDIVRYFPVAGSHSEMHIEHSVPKSWWGEQTNFIYDASFDLHHLVPSDASANMSKSNNVLGIVEKATFDNGVTRVGAATVDGKTLNAFEPDDEYKGDFARMYMYVATCYQDYTWTSDGVYMFNTENYPTLNAYSQRLLMEWHRQDPVSEKEVTRNDAVYAAQLNRNPFIDFPLLAEYLWGDSIGRKFSMNAGAYPRLITPAQGDVIDMGSVMQGGVATYDLTIYGQNLTAPLSLAWKGSAGISLSRESITAASAENSTSVILSYDNTELIGVLRDTLIITGGGLDTPVNLPVSVQGTPQFITLPAENIESTAATLRWVALPEATGYKVEVYRGVSKATDLFISAYVEGSSYNKAIAIYNGTNGDVPLSEYALYRQQNGIGTFTDAFKLPNKNLKAGETFILVSSQCSDETLRGDADVLVPSSEHSPLNFNGNDAVALYRNGIMIDVVGYSDMVEYWGQNMTLYRSTATLGPTVDFDMNDWRMAPIDDFASLRLHEMTALDPAPLCVATIETDATSYRIEDLTPETTYCYAVSATHSGKSVPALYGTLFTTESLSTPILDTPMEISSTGFSIEWGAIGGAEGYEVDCFTVEGREPVSEIEGFDSVGSNGKPLPEGWSGTASGNYTSAASSGEAAPSVGLKGDGQYIETPYYEDAITALSFMYRFASTATGSSLLVEAMVGDEWQILQTIAYENTTKHTETLAFEVSQDIHAFRFTYQKVAGNLAIDDVKITYGSTEREYVLQEQYVAVPRMEITHLLPLTTYHYRVRAVAGDKYSEWSSTESVTTLQDSGVMSYTIEELAYILCNKEITLRNLSAGSRVVIYSIEGLPCSRHIATSHTVTATLPAQGIYIVVVEDKSGVVAQKVVCR